MNCSFVKLILIVKFLLNIVACSLNIIHCGRDNQSYRNSHVVDAILFPKWQWLNVLLQSPAGNAHHADQWLSRQ